MFYQGVMDMVPTQNAEFNKMRKKIQLFALFWGVCPPHFWLFLKKNLDLDILHSDVQESAIKKKVSMSL